MQCAGPYYCLFILNMSWQQCKTANIGNRESVNGAEVPTERRSRGRWGNTAQWGKTAHLNI